MRLLLFVLAAVLLAGCTEIPAYECTEDYQCVRGDKKGRCEKNRICSFQSNGCDSGWRYAPQGTLEGCVPVEPPCTVEGLAAGGNFTCAVFTNGRVSCWGEGSSGQLGASVQGSLRSTPQKIDMLAGIVEVGAGTTHACGRHDDGTVSCWGDNTSQQLGDGTSTSRSRPAAIAGLNGVAALAIGGRHSCAQKTDGSLLCWGRNERGQLGDGTTMTRGTPTRVSAVRTEVAQVASGESHTCAILKDGGTVCWGQNRMGAVGAPMTTTQTGVPARVMGAPPAVAIGAGDNHSCVADDSGAVTCWGFNDLGQLGDKTLGRILEPVAVAGLAGVAAIDGGGAHSCALAKDGVGQCWGAGVSGQLGTGRFEDGAPAPVGTGKWKRLAAGQRHTCGLTPTGEVYCWGRAGEGQLGDGIALTAPLPEPTKRFELAKEVASGASHTCALTRAGTVFCWGKGDLGQLGSDTPGSTEPIAVDLPGVVQIAAGGDLTCARVMDGTVHCWGRGNRGQLGDGTTIDHRSRPRPVMLPAPAQHIAVGFEHACAVTMAGAAYCWGETQYGRLGNATTAVGVQNRPVAAGVGVEVTRITAGELHTCAVAKGGTVFCWGHTTYGQVGVAVSTTPSPPVQVPSLVEVATIAAGTHHTCALTVNGTVWCWGRGESSQLGYGTTASGVGAAQPVQVPRIDAVVGLAAGGNTTCTLHADGNLRCWGSNSRGQLGAGDYGNKTASATVVKNIFSVGAVDVGDRHVCAVQTDGATQCWGSNQFGQLGNGIMLEQSEPKRVELACP